MTRPPRRIRQLAGLAAGLCLVAVPVAPGASGHGAVERLLLVGRFSSPVYATSAPGEPARLYVVEQAGRIVVLVDGRKRAQPFLDIRSKVRSGGEQGLLSVAFDPGYARNRLFYVDYTDRNGDTRVVRYRSNGTAAVLSSAKQLLFVKDFASNHNGGQLQFGPDGRLYWGNGDGGDRGDPMNNGQTLTRPFAKIESIDTHALHPRWRLVAYGLRNPWRFSFDSATGDLYVGDVGQDRWEEIDYLARRASRPVNFGWRRFEAKHLYDARTPLLTRGRYAAPIFEYAHSQGCSVSGGYVYRGTTVTSARGRYFFGDYCSGTVWSLKVVNGKATAVRREPFEVRGLSSFGQDSRGELYLMSVDSGKLYRLVQ